MDFATILAKAKADIAKIVADVEGRFSAPGVAAPEWAAAALAEMKESIAGLHAPRAHDFGDSSDLLNRALREREAEN